MNSKLTLKLKHSVIARAKKYAKEHKTSLSRIEDFAQEEGITLYEAVKDVELVPDLQNRAKKAVSAFVQIIEGIDPNRKPSEVIEDVLGVVDLAVDPRGDVDDPFAVGTVDRGETTSFLEFCGTK